MSNYLDYVGRLAGQIEARFKEIEAVYNYDFGIETEVALCQFLSSILPEKFGICRGFVISEDGEQAGDDIIIYDRLSFPLIRTQSSVDFALKLKVPIEGVYAYIECKNSITDQKVLSKAIQQVEDVKKLLFKRDLKENPNYDRDGREFNGQIRDWPRCHSEFTNQPFTMIFTRDWDEGVEVDIANTRNCVDVLVLGSNHLSTQMVNLGSDGDKGAIFFDYAHWAQHRVDCFEGKSYGLGVVMLLQALSRIDLLPIDWHGLLNTEMTDDE